MRIGGLLIIILFVCVLSYGKQIPLVISVTDTIDTNFDENLVFSPNPVEINTGVYFNQFDRHIVHNLTNFRDSTTSFYNWETAYTIIYNRLMYDSANIPSLNRLSYPYLISTGVTDSIDLSINARELLLRINTQELVPICFLDIDFNFVDSTTNGFVLKHDSIFIASPYINSINASKNVKFLLHSDFYFTNKSNKPNLVFIDFGDGRGINQYSFGQIINVNYQSGQTAFRASKKLAPTTGGSRTEPELADTRSAARISAASVPEPTKKETLEFGVPSTWPHGGGKVKADLFYYTNSNNGKLHNPVIVSDGFDPGNTRDWYRDNASKG